MKTFLLFMMGVFAIASTQAQVKYYSAQESSRYQDNWQHYFAMYHSYYQGMTSLAFYSEKDANKELKSKEELMYHFKKGVKQEQAYSKSIFKYTDGLLTNYNFFKKGKLKTQFSFEYNEEGYYTRYYRGPVNSPKYEEQLVFNDSNRVVQYSTYNKKRELHRKDVIKYNDKQQIVRKDIYDGKHIDPKFTWLYKYNEEGKMIQTEYYKKGELKTKWVYTCDEEGTKVEAKNVKLKTTCSIVEHNNDGSYVKVYRNTDSKGKVQKSRWTYTKDSVLISYERINHKGVIASKYIYEYDAKGQRTTYTYYKKGGEKIMFRNTFKYNDDKKLTEKVAYNGKGKMLSKKQYKYDSSGNMIAFSVFNSKDEIKWKNEYTYDDQGELISELSYKKDKPYLLHNVVFNY
jgi:hypothetical protein